MKKSLINYLQQGDIKIEPVKIIERTKPSWKINYNSMKHQTSSNGTYI